MFIERQKLLHTKPSWQYLFHIQFWVFLFLFFFAFGIAVYALILPFLSFSGPIHTRLFNLPSVYFYMHTIGGAVALVIAPFQLLKKIDRTMHRYLGIIYICCVSASAIGGLYLAKDAYGGLSSMIALSLLSILWLFTSYMAVYQVFQKQFAAHRKWVIRSLALTFAAITLRLISPILYSYFSLYQAQQIIYWSCWIINLCIAEFYIQHYLHSAK